MPVTTEQQPAETPDRDSMTLDEYLQYMRSRTPEQIEAARAAIFANSPEPRPLPPGKTLEDVFVGALADDKTDEEIAAALRELGWSPPHAGQGEAMPTQNEVKVITPEDERWTMLSLEQRLAYMNNRTPEQIEAARAEARGSHRPRPLPPGKTLEDVFVGALPDDKTDEEIKAALDEIE